VAEVSRSNARRAAGFVGAALAPVGLWLAALQTPRFTWLNNGVRVEYPPAALAWALLAAAGASVAAAALGRRARPWLSLVALLALAYALGLARYRVAIEDAGIAERGILGSRRLAWKDVGRVESGTRRVVVWGRDEQQIRIDAAAFAGEDRARFDRTLSRRIRESASARP
jgi:hypothetical protein